MWHVGSRSKIIRCVLFGFLLYPINYLFLVYLEVYYILLIIFSDSMFITLIGRILSIFNTSVTLVIVIMEVYTSHVKVRLMTGPNVPMEHLVIGT